MKRFITSQLSRFASFGLYLAIHPWSKTLDIRLSHLDKSANPANPEFNEPCIFVFWHEYIAVPTMIWGNTGITLLVSQHRDADWLVNVSKSIGFGAIRGSTTRGGTAAIRACKEAVKTNSIAVTPDGPTGPRREMALGAIYLASRLQRPIVPVGFGYENPFRLRTWDKFAVPKPGSRIRAIMGNKVYIPRNANREILEAYRQSITDDINTLTEASERAVDNGSEIEKGAPFNKHRQYRKLSPVGEIASTNVSKLDFDLRNVLPESKSAAA